MFGIENSKFPLFQSLLRKKDVKKVLENTEWDDDKKASELYDLGFRYGIVKAKTAFYEFVHSSEYLKERYKNFKGLVVNDPKTGAHYTYSRVYVDYTILMRKLFSEE